MARTKKTIMPTQGKCTVCLGQIKGGLVCFMRHCISRTHKECSKRIPKLQEGSPEFLCKFCRNKETMAIQRSGPASTSNNAPAKRKKTTPRRKRVVERPQAPPPVREIVRRKLLRVQVPAPIATRISRSSKLQLLATSKGVRTMFTRTAWHRKTRRAEAQKSAANSVRKRLPHGLFW